jgi:hypothetical protein
LMVNGRATSFHQDDHKTSTANQSSLGNRNTSNSSWGLLRSGMSAHDYQHDDDYDEANDRWGLIRKRMNNVTFQQQDEYEDNTTARLTSWGTRSNSNSTFGSMINSGRSSQQLDSLSLRFGGGSKNNIPSRRSTVDAAGGGPPTGGGMRTTFPTNSCILEGSGVVVFPETHDDCDQHLWVE